MRLAHLQGLAVIARSASDEAIKHCHSGMRRLAQARNPEPRLPILKMTLHIAPREFRGYGFRVRAEPVIGPRFARTRWRAPE